MEYFVNIENTPFYHWQLELLIESFKVNNCQDKLLLSVAEANVPTQSDFTRNIKEHERTIFQENIGDIRGYKSLNCFYSLLWALKNDKLKQPFALIPAHVVLKTPLNLDFNKEGVAETFFLPDPFITIDKAEENVGNFWSWMQKTKEEYAEKWVTAGEILIFNNMPVELFERAIVIAEKLALFQIVNNKKIWEYTDRLAWAITLSNYSDKIILKGDYHFTSNMLEEGRTPFIDYEHGMPPVFNKRMFVYAPPNYVSFGDPFRILAENAPTPNSHFLSQLARNNLMARK